MLKLALRPTLLGFAALAITSATMGAPGDAVAAPPAVEVKLRDLDRQFVPQELLGGDREFGGNGPSVNCGVTLDISSDKRSILARIRFSAKETKADWSHVRGGWDPVVYTAPSGKTIEEIVGEASSTVSFVSKPAGFQILAPTEDFTRFFESFLKVSQAVFMFGHPNPPAPHNQAEQQMKQMAEKVIEGTALLMTEGNRVYVRRPTSGPVQVIGIVGDTGGPDISTDSDGKDDTRITGITFKPIKVRLK